MSTRMRRWLMRGVAAILLGLMAFASLFFLPWAPAVRPPDVPFSPPWSLPHRPLTVVTFNVEFGNRLDEALDVVREAQPDIVCLQEIKASQVAHIGRRLGMRGAWHAHFGAWGNCVFARGRVGGAGPIGAFGMWVPVEVDGARFIVASVHLTHAKCFGFGIVARARQTRELLRAVEAAGAPVIVAGDFNNPPFGGNYSLLSARLTDAGASGATLPSSFPLVRIDYVFVTREWERVSARTVATTVSDHRPVVATLRRR